MTALGSQSSPVSAPSRRGYAMGLMVLSSVFISFGGLIIRNIEAADPWQINFYRAIAFAVAVSLILLFRYGRTAPRQLRRIGPSGIIGGVVLAVAGITFLQALTTTTVANTLFILGAIPFITAALAKLFLGEALSRATLITMVIAALGILVMLAEGFGFGSAYGNAMALITAFCFATFAVIVRRNRRVDMTPAFLVSAAVLVLVALTVRFGDLGITLRDLLLCILWGGVISGMANAMFIIASRHLIAAELTLFMLLEFALGPIWVWLFVGEIPTRWTVLGGILVITALALRAGFELRNRRPAANPGGLA